MEIRIIIFMMLLSFTGYSQTCSNCEGEPPKTITANLNGGSPVGLTYSWSGPGGYTAGTGTVTPAGPGEYCVTVTYTATCEDVQCITVVDVAAPDCSCEYWNGLNWVGLCDALICEGDLENATSPLIRIAQSGFDYAWSGPAGYVSTSQGIIPPQPGEYDVIVTDPATGCSKEHSFFVNEIDPPTVPPTTIDPASCGNSDGDIFFANPDPNYIFEWSTGATTANLTGVPAGSYTVTILDGANLCETVETITIPDNEGPMINAVQDITLCGTSGMVTFNVSLLSTSDQPYLYQLYNPFGNAIQDANACDACSCPNGVNSPCPQNGPSVGSATITTPATSVGFGGTYTMEVCDQADTPAAGRCCTSTTFQIDLSDPNIFIDCND